MTETAPMTTGQYLMARRIKSRMPHATTKYIAHHVGATERQIRAAIGHTTHPRYQKKDRPGVTGRKKHRPSNIADHLGRQVAGICEHAGISVPETVLQERERRLAQSPRSMTAAWLGDPLPGYSALDKRQG